MVLDFLLHSPYALFVEFETVHLAQFASFRARRTSVAIEDGASSRMSERPAPSSGLDDSLPGPRAQPVQNVAIVRSVDDLGSMGEGSGPGLGGWVEEVQEAAGSRLGGFEGLGVISGVVCGWGVEVVGFALRGWCAR